MANADRFWSKVNKTDGCWLWTTGCFARGYGMFSVGGWPIRAHRFSWELAHGPLPEGMFVRHTCDTPSCVRPDHLVLGSHDENMADMVDRGRSLRGEDHPRAKLTNQQVEEIRQRYAAGESQGSLAKEFGVVQPHISRLVRRQETKR